MALSAGAQVRVQAGDTSVVVGGGTSVVVGGGGVDVRAGDSTSVTTKGADVSIGKGNVVGSRVGSIAPGKDQQGVAVVNGRVYIDGKEIPPKVTRYKSLKTGEVYIIHRDGGSVEVTTE
jgi:hypothetical protein